jgi:spermidine/putrescine transport system ATP-binding protein
VGVRPEKIKISRKEPAASSSRTVLGPGTVVDTSFTGVSTQYVVDMPGLKRMSVFEQNDGDIVAKGSTVWLSWATEYAFGIPFDTEEFVESDASTRSLSVVKR